MADLLALNTRLVFLLEDDTATVIYICRGWRKAMLTAQCLAHLHFAPYYSNRTTGYVVDARGPIEARTHPGQYIHH